MDREDSLDFSDEVLPSATVGFEPDPEADPAHIVFERKTRVRRLLAVLHPRWTVLERVYGIRAYLDSLNYVEFELHKRPFLARRIQTDSQYRPLLWAVEQVVVRSMDRPATQRDENDMQWELCHRLLQTDRELYLTRLQLQVPATVSPIPLRTSSSGIGRRLVQLPNITNMLSREDKVVVAANDDGVENSGRGPRRATKRPRRYHD